MNTDKYLDADYQRAVGEFVSRGVIACASSLVYELAQRLQDEDLLDAFRGPIDYEEAATQENWERADSGLFYRATGFEHYLSINLHERGQMHVSVHKQEFFGQEANGAVVWEFSGSEEESVDLDGSESLDLTEADAVEQYLYEQGIFTLEDSLSKDSEALFETCSADTWQDLCGIESIETEDYEREIFEHWIVSDCLADKLETEGEKIMRDFFGFTIWGRSTTGQAISIDQVICDIYDDMQETQK